MNEQLRDSRNQEVAQVFIKQYNLKKDTRYKFECFRESLFNKDYPVVSKFYQIAFVEGEKHHPIIADLMVLFRLQKRLIVEVVGPKTAQKREIGEDWGIMRAIIYGLEFRALSGVVCSRYLLIDGRHFTYTKEYDRESYKKNEFIIDKLGTRRRSRLIPPKHWFKEIWFLYYNKTGILECFQIW